MTRIPAVRRAIVAERSVLHCVAIVAAALLGATGVRLVLSIVGAGLTFATFFPAVLMCTLLAGWRYGSACALLSGVVAELLFPRSAAIGQPHVFAGVDFLLFLTSCAVIIATGDALRRALRDLDDAVQRANNMNRELQHRVGNLLSVVQALASQSAKGSSPDTFIDTFTGRLKALSKAHALLRGNDLDTCTLPELIDEACEPFCDGANIIKTGPPCQLPAESCVPLVLALHELCTNAVKYGALSTPLGRVEISWAFADRPDRVVIEWKESGGPAVVQPTRKGLGSSLLKRRPGMADVKLSFEKAGLCCWFTVDGARALGPTSPAHPPTEAAPLLG